MLSCLEAPKPFKHLRTIRFAETDAAGVVYFANLLVLCHDAYEAALAAAGFDLSLFFSREDDVALPIVHTAADFYQPMKCGDAIAVHLNPTQLDAYSFEVHYVVHSQIQPASAEDSADKRSDRAIAKALTRHVCINSKTRRRQSLSDELTRWIGSFDGN